MNCTPDLLKKQLMAYEHILVTAHVSPDGDAIGSVAAFGELLRHWNKDVHIVIDDDIEEKFYFLPEVATIQKPEDVTTDDTWLTVILDATSKSRTGRVADLIKGEVINIDHHVSNDHEADFEYILPSYAATAEIIATLCRNWLAVITPTMAEALYLGLATDCGFFKYSNTTSHTLITAANLVTCGARPQIISEHLEETTLTKLKALSEVLKHIEIVAHNKAAGIAFTQDVLAYTGEHTGDYIDYPRNVKGVDIAFTVKYVSPEETRVSLRSKRTDVNAIASVFGGGGHIRAAGCTIKAPLEEAKAKLIAEIERAL